MRLIHSTDNPTEPRMSIMSAAKHLGVRWVILDVALLSMMAYNWPVRLMDILR
ncbi:hypothetical protein [Burkholderia phage vB_BglM_WTB]